MKKNKLAFLASCCFATLTLLAGDVGHLVHYRAAFKKDRIKSALKCVTLAPSRVIRRIIAITSIGAAILFSLHPYIGTHYSSSLMSTLVSAIPIHIFDFY